MAAVFTISTPDSSYRIEDFFAPISPPLHSHRKEVLSSLCGKSVRDFLESTFQLLIEEGASPNPETIEYHRSIEIPTIPTASIEKLTYSGVQLAAAIYGQEHDQNIVCMDMPSIDRIDILKDRICGSDLSSERCWGTILHYNEHYIPILSFRSATGIDIAIFDPTGSLFPSDQIAKICSATPDLQIYICQNVRQAALFGCSIFCLEELCSAIKEINSATTLSSLHIFFESPTTAPFSKRSVITEIFPDRWSVVKQIHPEIGDGAPRRAPYIEKATIYDSFCIKDKKNPTTRRIFCQERATRINSYAIRALAGMKKTFQTIIDTPSSKALERFVSMQTAFPQNPSRAIAFCEDPRLD